MLLFGALTLLTFFGLSEAFGNGDEVIYAQNVREMRESGDWGALRWQGINTFQRPTLPFVLSMIGESFLGGEFGLRFPMAIFSLLTLVIVYAASFSFWRQHDAACIAAALCAAVPSFHLFTRSLLSDAPFVAMTTLALVGTMWSLRDKRGLLLAGAGLGGAVAVKSMAVGPIGLALAPWLLYSAYQHRAYRQLLWAVLISCVLALPYFVYSYLRYGTAFIDGHIGWTLGKRVTGEYGDTVGLAGGIGAYPSHIWNADGLLVVLWLLLALIGGAIFWRRDKALGCAATTALVTLALFSLVGTRLPHYILPIYPALAITLAGAYATITRRYSFMSAQLPRLLVGAIILSVVMLGITRPMPSSYLLPSPAAKAIGLEVARLNDSRPLYTLDWYAPACAYYANKPWLALFSSPELVHSLNSGIQFFQEADNIQTAPPWPSGSYLLAAPTESIAAANLPLSKVLLELGDAFVLVEVQSP